MSRRVVPWQGLRQQSDAVVLLMQEHHAMDRDRLATLQHTMLDHGHAGAWAAAAEGAHGSDGAFGCAAVLARTNVVVTSPPFLDSPVLAVARLVAARAHKGVAGGLVAASPCLRDSVGWNEENQRLAMALVRYLARLNAAGLDWAAGGDFNMSAERFPTQPARDARGLWAAPDTATRGPRVGARPAIDYFLFAANLATRTGMPQVFEEGTTSPHLPVGVTRLSQDLPMKVRAARMPRPIGPVPPIGCSRGVEDWRRQLAKVRRRRERRAALPVAEDAVVDTIEQVLLDRYEHVEADRAKYIGRSGALETALVAVAWRPPRRRAQLGRRAPACRAASRRARHAMGAGAYAAKALRQLHGAGLLRALDSRQRGKLAEFLLEAGAYMRKIVAQHRGTLSLPPHWAQDFFQQQLRVLKSEGLVEQAVREALKSQQQAWGKWANDAFRRGAGQTRRYSKVRDLQEVVSTWHGEQQEASPQRVCDREMKPREKARRCHGLQPSSVPGDVGERESMPELTVEQLRQAALSFPCSTAIVPAQIGMRFLNFLSDEGMCACAQLFMRIERLGTWPEGRIWHAICRLPKPSGGCRLVPLMHSLVRRWSRARAAVSWGWLRRQTSVNIWGLGAGMSSSDAAFDLNLETEVAVNLQVQVITAPMGAWKFFEAVVPAALLQEARQLRMQMPLAWLLIELRRQPRGRQAFGSVSYEAVSVQGGLAGCAHACALVSVLLHRLLERTRGMGVAPRALVSDVTMQWVGEAGRRTQSPWAAAPRADRRAAARRRTQDGLPVARRAATQRGPRVAGATDDKPKRLRAEARPAGPTVYLAPSTAPPTTYNPIYEATVALVVMHGSNIICDPRAMEDWMVHEQQIQVLTASPSDLKAFLLQGSSGFARCPCAGGKGAELPEGPAATSLAIHWTGTPWTRQRFHEVLPADSATRLARGDEADTPGRRPHGGEALLMARHGEEERAVLPEKFQEAPASRVADVRLRGEWQGRAAERRGKFAFTDGPSFASSMPEMRRRGRSVVQLGANGAPGRAVFGALPGPLQTAGRAERHSVLQAVRLLGSQVEFTAAHLPALAREASGVCAASHRPSAFWIPAHKNAQGGLELDIHPMLYTGNTRADFFANQGTTQHAVAQVYIDARGIEAQRYKKVAAYIGLATQRCPQLGGRQQPARAAPPPPARPCARVTVVEHALVHAGGRRGLLRRECVK
ncbi:unnamed protein product [Prorocentrum cordatum]|uniref:Uncharacterized protein n=1 Tax=Prorocentrum cordatum TaxID=2364126 RepID=A0ABN9U5D2_9DINO|nr:unnamed protein product [Polarella glacialis]